MQRQFGERAAMNMPLQGTAADIIKMAMINVQKALAESDLDIKLLLQVHDELVFEVADKDVAEAEKMIKQIMESVVHLSVPLIAEVGVAQNWKDAH